MAYPAALDVQAVELHADDCKLCNADDALTRRLFTRDEKVLIAERAGWRCEAYPSQGFRCLETFNDVGNLQGDHLIPHDGGGVTCWDHNGAALCPAHNVAKSDSEPPQWLLHAIAQHRAAHAAEQRKAN